MANNNEEQSYGLLLSCLLILFAVQSRSFIRVRRDLHQRHDRDAEEAAEHQPDDESDHVYPSLFHN